MAAISAPVANALPGLLPAPNDGFLPFKPTAGDVLLAVSLDFSLSGELEALFKGDGLRGAAPPEVVVVVLPVVSRGRRAVVAPLAGAECVNLGAGRAVKVFVMVVVVVVVALLVELPLAVADLTRVVLVVALLVFATPLASGLVGLRAPTEVIPDTGAVLRSVEPKVLRGEGTFGLVAGPPGARVLLLLLLLLPVIVVDLLAVKRRDLAAVPLLLVVVVANLRAVVVVVVALRAAVVVVAAVLLRLLLPLVLLPTGAVPGRVFNVVLRVLAVGLPAKLLAASGFRVAAVLAGLAAPVVVGEAVGLAAPVVGAVRGRAAASLGAAAVPTVLFLVIAPAVDGLAFADVVVGAVFAAGFLAASLGLALTLALEATPATAATAAVAATVAAAVKATSDAGESPGPFSWETDSEDCSTSFSATDSGAIGCSNLNSSAGSEVSLLISPFV